MSEHRPNNRQDDVAVQAAEFIARLIRFLVLLLLGLLRFIAVFVISLGRTIVSSADADPLFCGQVRDIAVRVIGSFSPFVEQLRVNGNNGRLVASINETASLPRQTRSNIPAVHTMRHVPPVVAPVPVTVEPVAPVNLSPAIPIDSVPVAGPLSQAVPTAEADNYDDLIDEAILTPEVIRVPLTSADGSELGDSVAIIEPDAGLPGTWYAVIVGRSVGVYQDWANVGPMVTGVPRNTSTACASYGEAVTKFRTALARNLVRVVRCP